MYEVSSIFHISFTWTSYRANSIGRYEIHKCVMHYRVDNFVFYHLHKLNDCDNLMTFPDILTVRKEDAI